MTFRIVLYVVVSVFIMTGCQADKLTMDKIVGKNTPKVLSDKFMFTEGPLWVPAKKGVIFSDIPANKMYIYQPGKGVSVFRDPSNFSNGSALDKDGNIITAQHDRTITKTDTKGKITVIARTYKGKKLNSPNDIAIAKNGDIYFTDPHFGLIGYGPKKAPEEQPVRGIYRLKKDGTVELLFGKVKIPNGIAFSPKEDVLYVTDSADGKIYRFDVKKDGTLEGFKLFHEQPKRKGFKPNADGIRVDKLGNVYAAAPGCIAIYTPKGELIGTVNMKKKPSNLAWGDDDYKTLYITSINRLCSLKTLIGKK